MGHERFLHPAIAVAGEPSSGKTRLCMALSEFYGMPIVSMGDLFRKMHKTWKRSNPDARGNIDFISYWGNGHVSDIDIVRANDDLRKRLESSGDERRVVIDSRYIHENCKDLGIPKIYLHADVNVKAERIVDDTSIRAGTEYYKKSANEIIAILKRRKQDEIRNGLRIFGFDYTDKRLYNLVMDTSNLSVGEELIKVVELLQ